MKYTVIVNLKPLSQGNPIFKAALGEKWNEKEVTLFEVDYQLEFVTSWKQSSFSTFYFFISPVGLLY